tara:strand:+ start:1400 stop:1537 length:138 start_codon:yes stop_codon:yes gene_type:complete
MRVKHGRAPIPDDFYADGSGIGGGGSQSATKRAGGNKYNNLEEDI